MIEICELCSARDDEIPDSIADFCDYTNGVSCWDKAGDPGYCQNGTMRTFSWNQVNFSQIKIILRFFFRAHCPYFCGVCQCNAMQF